MSRLTEEEVITVLRYHGNCMTYYLANVITAKRGYGVRIKTPQVLRLLKRMEQEGKVKRVKSSYAVQICWALVAQEVGDA